ncbi:hypothetical protein [Bradyrhizobium cenepequi]|uniref:hypothetical protein n=1 Tax=Bradyrhizobium cenepequi TaxID=2821403 RepID=UPI001CE32A74|nr:hypothetical protein [Bradyrhizobium cenepequi]MCA6108077.1 hypothetical protein [Bradyrhizobium cenepequi]
MNTLTRRRDKDSREECWHVFYGDVHVGTINIRAGVPRDSPRWGWSCGFYPGLEPNQHRAGEAETFEGARAEFEKAWNDLLPRLSETAFQEWRFKQAETAWKHRMWDEGLKLPTQERSGIAKCFCGAVISIAGLDAHIAEAHSDMR